MTLLAPYAENPIRDPSPYRRGVGGGGITYGTNSVDVPPFTPGGTFVDGVSGETLEYDNYCTQQTFLGERLLFHKFKGRWLFLDRCERNFQYHLATGWTGGLAIAYRLSMDGVSSGALVMVRDPLGMFSSQAVGAKGYMVYTVEDKFYASQSPCTSSSAPPSVAESSGNGCCAVATTFSGDGSPFYVPGLTPAQCAAQNFGYGSVYLGDGSTCPSSGSV